MPTITAFRGLRCDDLDASQWQHHICAHLKPLIGGQAGAPAMRVAKVLVGCNRTAEVFVFVADAIPPLSAFDPAATSELQEQLDGIRCNICCCDLYGLGELT
jgi:hypothetical protein